jgi:very-short-patch-repair endonuclease
MKFDSPLERLYYYTWLDKGGAKYFNMAYQYDIPNYPYRVDFAIPELKIAIELDSYKHHTNPYAFTNDRERQRTLEFSGWRFIRFSGREINKKPKQCVVDTKRFIDMIRKERMS